MKLKALMTDSEIIESLLVSLNTQIKMYTELLEIETLEYLRGCYLGKIGVCRAIIQDIEYYRGSNGEVE